MSATMNKPAGKKELLATAKTLGITTINRDSRVDEIRAAINEVLGVPNVPGNTQEDDERVTDSYVATINEHGPEAVAKPTGPVLAGSRDIPNLAPNGQWQGKRARIMRIKTGKNDIGGAMFQWNGWPCIIPIGVEVDVAWPILEILKTTRGLRITIEQQEDARNKGRVQNIRKENYYDKYPFQFMGVTPGTEHLPESAWEYTLDQYVDDFPGYTVRMWRQLCGLWEMSDQDCKLLAGASPDEEAVTRRNAIHYKLNLPQGVDRETRLRVRNEKRADIGMTARAA